MNNLYLSSVAAVALSACGGVFVQNDGPRRHPAPILVVDDDASVRRLTVRLLERAGYSALQAEDGEHALAMLEARNGEVALVLSDVQMPGMGGLELARAVELGFPAVRTVLMSAYSDHLLSAANARFFLPKPFTQDLLLKTIQSALHPPAK